MKFIADENVSRFIIQSLADAGHDIISVHDVGLKSAVDEAIIQFGIAEGRVIITHDRDFGGLLRYSARKSSGVILIRLRQPSPQKTWKALQKALASLTEARIQGHIIVIEDSRIRISGD